ncbi:helix-turn-helix domain-containing protein [Rossellomorea aquimaris]|jgi:HTH-type transcriptional regulator, pleiotropic regulator of extracellular virulence genes|uniref:Helix-turn-helix transcriptional regulator n=1 Tax=Rossellomorea aquimaris TaxID=189382 RepID=A0A5D4U6U8_9BACI|nr:helix-turn-helix domain-containing protein [Rossellomorea aquimaris]TYS76427.1 helix-turn-helix transcriptional regulator [Rossellomorea aquimaris]TYS83017.1 helix-turn-helix transcriptional regulator [Rossellomorea aquimaris]
MGITDLGKEIIRLRKQNSMTQNDLAQGVCTQAALSLIERGQTKPTLETIFFISLKLNKPISYFLQYLLDDNVEYINRTVSFIENLAIKQRFNDVHQLTQKELRPMENNNRTWFEQYLRWMNVISSYRLKRENYQMTVSLLKDLLKEEYFLINQKGFLHFKILNSLALIHGENDNLTSSLMYYNKALKSEFKEVTPSLLRQPEIYRLRILYNKAKTLYDLKKYQEALETVVQGIKESKENENISMLGNFYYYQGQCYEKMNGDCSSIKEAYRNAEFIYGFLGNDTYLNIVRELKKGYLENE